MNPAPPKKSSNQLERAGFLLPNCPETCYKVYQNPDIIEVTGICDIISYEGGSVVEIRTAFEEAVDGYLAHCAAMGKEQNKSYWGLFKGLYSIRLYGRLHLCR